MMRLQRLSKYFSGTPLSLACLSSMLMGRVCVGWVGGPAGVGGVLCNDLGIMVENAFSIGVLSTVKIWLPNHFEIQVLGEASYILRNKLFRDQNDRVLDLSQTAYIDKVLVCCA